MVHLAQPKAGRGATALTRYPRFEIHAARCPGLLPRIVGLFAAQALIPTDLRARQSPGGMWISVEADIDQRHAGLFAEKLRAIVSVETVILILLPAPVAPMPDQARVDRAPSVLLPQFS